LTTIRVIAAVLGCFTAAAAQAGGANTVVECSPALTNSDCVVTLNRRLPVSPLTIRLRPDRTATILVLEKRPTEDILFEPEYKDIETPDPFVGIFTQLLPSLKGLRLRSDETPGLAAYALAEPDTQVTDDRVKPIIDELERILEAQGEVKVRFDVTKKAVDQAIEGLTQLRQGCRPNPAETDKDRFGCRMDIANFEQSRTETLNLMNAALGTADASEPLTSGTSLRSLDIRIAAVIRQFEAIQPPVPHEDARLFDTLLDDVDFNQRALATSMKLIEEVRTALRAAADVLTKLTNPEFRAERNFVAGLWHPVSEAKTRGIGRAAAVKVIAQDKFTKEKTQLAVVPLEWGGTRWEVSLGSIFSLLPDRSFQAAPVAYDAEGNVTARKITETKSTPAVVPLAMGHFRPVEWLLRGRRAALLIGGGVGINPYNTQAEFAIGPSFAYRNFIVSPVVHLGRDVRLADPFDLGQQHGGALETLATERFWRAAFAVAIGYRVPIN
jgi:hypothetical protein